MPSLQHKCPHCEFLNKKEVSYIDPSEFTNPALAAVSYSYWCFRCEALIGIRYSFDSDKNVVVIEDYMPKPSLNVPINVARTPSPVHYENNEEATVVPDQDSVEF